MIDVEVNSFSDWSAYSLSAVSSGSFVHTALLVLLLFSWFEFASLFVSSKSKS